MFRNSQIIFNFYKYKRKLLSNVKYLTTKPSENRLKILFFGTDNFSLPSLSLLYNESKQNTNISSVGVVTSFKNPANPIRNFALEKNLRLHKWPIETEIASRFDLGVVVSFGHLIPSKIISSFPYGMINVHASLLPRWRGAAPIIYSIMNGDKITGVTIMKIEPKHFDIGEILAQKEVQIEPNILLPSLYEQLSKEGAHLLVDTINKMPECLQKSKQQSQKLVTYAPKITPSMSEVRWSDMTSNQVYNLYRALYSYKHLTTKFEDNVIKIIHLKFDCGQTASGSNGNNYKPGLVDFSRSKKCLKIYCKDGLFVEVYKVKVEGRKTMTANDFNNGFLKKAASKENYFE